MILDIRIYENETYIYLSNINDIYIKKLPIKIDLLELDYKYDFTLKNCNIEADNKNYGPYDWYCENIDDCDTVEFIGQIFSNIKQLIMRMILDKQILFVMPFKIKVGIFGKIMTNQGELKDLIYRGLTDRFKEKCWQIQTIDDKSITNNP